MPVVQGDWNSGWRPAGWGRGVTHSAERLEDDLSEDIAELQHQVLHGDVVLSSVQHLRRRRAAHKMPEERMRHRRLSNLIRESNDLNPLIDEEMLRWDNWTNSPWGHRPEDQNSAVTKDAMLAYRAAHIGRSLAQEDGHPAPNLNRMQTHYDVPGASFNGGLYPTVYDRYDLTRSNNTVLTPRVKEVQQEALGQLIRDMSVAHSRGKLANQRHVGKVHVGKRGGRFVFTTGGGRRYLH